MLKLTKQDGYYVDNYGRESHFQSMQPKDQSPEVIELVKVVTKLPYRIESELPKKKEVELDHSSLYKDAKTSAIFMLQKKDYLKNTTTYKEVTLDEVEPFLFENDLPLFQK